MTSGFYNVLFLVNDTYSSKNCLVPVDFLDNNRVLNVVFLRVIEPLGVKSYHPHCSI